MKVIRSIVLGISYGAFAIASAQQEIDWINVGHVITSESNGRIAQLELPGKTCLPYSIIDARLYYTDDASILPAQVSLGRKDDQVDMHRPPHGGVFIGKVHLAPHEACTLSTPGKLFDTYFVFQDFEDAYANPSITQQRGFTGQPGTY